MANELSRAAASLIAGHDRYVSLKSSSHTRINQRPVRLTGYFPRVREKKSSNGSRLQRKLRIGKNATTRANMCAHKRCLSSRLLSISLGARDEMERFIAQAAVCMCVYVYCRRKAVITMLNERFVALYSDDISPVTDCDGLANIFRSRRHTARDASENCPSSGASLRIARASSTKSCDYVNVLLCELFTVTSLNHQMYLYLSFLAFRQEYFVLWIMYVSLWSASREIIITAEIIKIPRNNKNV